MKRLQLLFLAILLLCGLAACESEPVITPTATRTPGPVGTVPPVFGEPTEAVETTPVPAAEEEPVTVEELGAVGPTDFPSNVDPLTGLIVDDPSVLDRPPLLIKVSNSPPSVRPQSGLASADQVWEHAMEGYRIATRYTAVFLSQTPERVGSVRSGRLPDLELVPMYEGIYVASGYSTNRNAPGTPPRVRELMLDADWVERNFSYEFGYRDPYSVRIPIEGKAVEHTLFSIPAELWKLAEERNIGPSTTLEPGFMFDKLVPDGGIETSTAQINYPGPAANNTWQFDAESGTWLLWTDDAPHGDDLTGEQLAFENVVVVYAKYYDSDFIEDEPSGLHSVGVTLTGEGDAVLLRDGLRYELTWKRASEDSMIQFFDASGAQIPFKPGRTWFHLVSTDFEPPEIIFEQSRVSRPFRCLDSAPASPVTLVEIRRDK